MNEKMMIDKVSKILSLLEKDEDNKYENISDDDKKRAAFALNMCTVSVSQIIDYADVFVLEHEYEAILGNLNLENMPKDEALLNILKQLLDVITYFRIENEEKKVLEKEYQHKMKNAIWNAVPNFGLIVSGGSPVSIAVSLASQIGIGYMNYRRAKADLEVEKVRQDWELRKTAVEQLEGLQRELFDTAWRLADAYGFPDEYRLTERQIRQYNDILMDDDEIRKYERLTTIKDKFVAYPPFWYFYGNTANYIARDKSLPLSDVVRDDYKIRAIKHFRTFWQSNKYALLREDHIASSCALELIDLLDIEKDRNEIIELIDKAVIFSGNANDILQLCAIAYLRIGDTNKAANIFRILVNEQYNTIINAQILSGLYVSRVIATNDTVARAKYETLATRVNNEYLIRLPEFAEKITEQELKNEFSENQEKLLMQKFSAVITYSFNNYIIKLGKILPTIDDKEEYPDSYYSMSGKKQRQKEFESLFTDNGKKRLKDRYIERLSQCGFINAYFKELNQFFGTISELNCIKDRQKLQEIITNIIISFSKRINEIRERMDKKAVVLEDVIDLLMMVSSDFYCSFNEELFSQIKSSISLMNDMTKYAIADTKLREFCDKYDIPEIDSLLNNGKDNNEEDYISTYFSMDLLGNSGVKLQNDLNLYRKIENVIRGHMEHLNSISDKADAYFYDSQEFNEYFEVNKNLRNHKDILQNTIAIYDDKSIKNVDLLFTVDGVVPIIRNSIKDTIPYMNLIAEDKRNSFIEKANNIIRNKKNIALLGALNLLGPAGLVIGGGIILDANAIKNVINEIQPMIEEICLITLENE